MKKILLTALALLLIICAAVSLAEGTPSIVLEEVEQAITDVPGITVVKTDATEETAAIMESLFALGAENVLSAIPEEIAAAIPEGFTEVNEITTQKIVGDISELTQLSVTYTFTAPYKVGEKVYLVICIPGENGEAEWITVEGEADADGNVVATYDKDTLAKLANNEFIVMVVNKKSL